VNIIKWVYETIKPKYCKKCGAMLMHRCEPVRFDEHTGQATRARHSVECPMYGVSSRDHTYFEWEEKA